MIPSPRNRITRRRDVVGMKVTDWMSPIVDATGGTVSYDGNFRIHTFTADGMFTVIKGGLARYLVVGGGGAGGRGFGGGGGGGGVLEGDIVLSPLSLAFNTIAIGTGGVKGTYPTASTWTTFIYAGTYLADIQYIRSNGGGYGGSTYDDGEGSAGASGGGKTWYKASGYNNGIDGQGFHGGSNIPWQLPYAGAGGGGAGEAGFDSSSTRYGGKGKMSRITGQDVYYGAGGGGGGAESRPNTFGYGGLGGGGNGSCDAGGQDGSFYGAAGGGGGMSTLGALYDGGSGYQGVVIIRYRYK